MAGGLSSPFDYREVMQAQVGYIDKTVDQVIAEQEAREKQREADAKAKASGARTAAPTEAGVAPVAQSEMDKLNALFAKAAASNQDRHDLDE